MQARFKLFFSRQMIFGFELVGICLSITLATSNYNQPLDRSFSMRLAEPITLEGEIARAMESDQIMSFIYPRPCLREGDASTVCGEAHGFAFEDSARSGSLYLTPGLGYEYRYDAENVHSFEGGILATGNRRALSFYLDARMFTEMHENFDHPSYDREFIEKQDEQASGSIAYTSYSRYRTNLNYDFAFGRLSAGRDVAHWGPGLNENLVFNRESIPFNQITFTTGIGPLRVHTLYGQLQGEDNRVSGKTAKSRSVYAHRYEWALGRDWVLGVTEQMIVYSYEEPFAFIPVIPLFIFKGGAYERLNNGNIAADFNWRFAPWGRVYSEFLIDDIQSPSSLFDDNWGNKWAVMGGMQGTRRVGDWDLGAVVEATRIEPWIYTHYEPGTAQALNRGVPLGNPIGPDALVFKTTVYGSHKGYLIGSKVAWLQKGGGLGSGLFDSHDDRDIQKHFLSGPVDETVQLQAFGGWRWRRVSLRGDLRWDMSMSSDAQDGVTGWVGIRY